jgi:hypothetical protein
MFFAGYGRREEIHEIGATNPFKLPGLLHATSVIRPQLETGTDEPGRVPK